MLLQDQVAVVTGGGRGIGRAIAILFAQHGARVAVADKDLSSAESVVAELEEPAHGLALAVDVTKPEQVKRMLTETNQHWGRLDTLVCNAGISRSTPFQEMTESDWDQMIETNLKSMFLCCRVALEIMMPRRSGQIITIASIAGKRGGGIFGRTDYAASKGGVLGFTRALAREAIGLGIRVNGICPGATETDLIASITAAQREHVIAQTPIGRFARPDEIAGAALFLASELSSYCVGEFINVDGGVVMD